MGSRKNYAGDHLVRIKTKDLISALTIKAIELGLKEAELCQRMGVSQTMLSTLRSENHQGSMFSQNLKKITSFLEVPEDHFTTRGKKWGYKKNGAAGQPVPTDVIILTMDYYKAIQAAPAEERARARKLLELLENR